MAPFVPQWYDRYPHYFEKFSILYRFAYFFASFCFWMGALILPLLSLSLFQVCCTREDTVEVLAVQGCEQESIVTPFKYHHKPGKNCNVIHLFIASKYLRKRSLFLFLMLGLFYLLNCGQSLRSAQVWTDNCKSIVRDKERYSIAIYLSIVVIFDNNSNYSDYD